jgi:signal transduction histidine kinase
LTFRIAAIYLGIFVFVLLALNAGAYVFVAREYASQLAPVLAMPEGSEALNTAMRHVLVTLIAIDAPLVALVAVASYLLARATIVPLEAARERERVFAADAAHELRSPLSAIAAVAQAARATAEPQARAAFESIARSALDASDVVSDLLTLARDPARQALHVEPVDLGAVVAGSSREMEPIASARGIKLESSPSSAIVDGEERRLRELARNLLENALRHARERVSIVSRQNGASCELVVEDDGDGIPPADRERIFVRFYRRADDGVGTGLGLSIVRWIARAHDGTVTVDEGALGGARFVASIPAHDGKE